MKQLLFIIAILLAGATSQAQFTNASLQASGLTCSMCSKAVKEALEKVPFVSKIDVDLKNQQYKMQFKKDAAVNFDALSKAVTDAGFSVASLNVTTDVNALKASKDKHLLVRGQ